MIKDLKDKMVNVVYYDCIGTGALTNTVTLKKVVLTDSIMAFSNRVTFAVFNNKIYVNSTHIVKIELAE